MGSKYLFIGGPYDGLVKEINEPQNDYKVGEHLYHALTLEFKNLSIVVFVLEDFNPWEALVNNYINSKHIGNDVFDTNTLGKIIDIGTKLKKGDYEIRRRA